MTFHIVPQRRFPMRDDNLIWIKFKLWMDLSRESDFFLLPYLHIGNRNGEFVWRKTCGHVQWYIVVLIHRNTTSTSLFSSFYFSRYSYNNKQTDPRYFCYNSSLCFLSESREKRYPQIHIKHYCGPRNVFLCTRKRITNQLVKSNHNDIFSRNEKKKKR